MKYDESQIKNHYRRNHAQNKMLKQMIYQFDLMFGQNNTGLFLAIILDCLNKMMKQETPDEFINLRTIEIKFNDCYSVKYDFEKEGYVE